jgi:hypothetical protein
MLDIPTFQNCQESNGLGDMMDEDVMNNVSVRLKLSLTVWDFTLPVTPSISAVFGVSWQYSLYYGTFFISVVCTAYSEQHFEFIARLFIKKNSTCKG